MTLTRSAFFPGPTPHQAKSAHLLVVGSKHSLSFNVPLGLQARGGVPGLMFRFRAGTTLEGQFKGLLNFWILRSRLRFWR